MGVIMLDARIAIIIAAKPKPERYDHPQQRAYLTPVWRRRQSKRYRDQMRLEKRCINGRSHGPATHGCRCYECYLVHGGSSG